MSHISFSFSFILKSTLVPGLTNLAWTAFSDKLNGETNLMRLGKLLISLEHRVGHFEIFKKLRESTMRKNLPALFAVPGIREKVLEDQVLTSELLDEYAALTKGTITAARGWYVTFQPEAGVQTSSGQAAASKHMTWENVYVTRPPKKQQKADNKDTATA